MIYMAYYTVIGGRKTSGRLARAHKLPRVRRRDAPRPFRKGKSSCYLVFCASLAIVTKHWKEILIELKLLKIIYRFCKIELKTIDVDFSLLSLFCSLTIQSLKKKTVISNCKIVQQLRYSHCVT